MALHLRGGFRTNSGRKSTWSTSETVTIRVPHRLAARLLEIGHGLDSGSSFDSDTESKDVLSKVKSILSKWQEDSDRYSPSPNTRWDNTRKLIKELREVFEPLSVPQHEIEFNEHLQLDIVNSLEVSKPLTGMQLAERLKVSEKTIRSYKEKAEFPEWSKSKDPEGLSWMYEKSSKQFYPIPPTF